MKLLLLASFAAMAVAMPTTNQLNLPVETQDYSWHEFGDDFLTVVNAVGAVASAAGSFAGKRSETVPLPELKDLPVELQDKFSWHAFAEGFKKGALTTLQYAVPVVETAASLGLVGKRDVQQGQELLAMTDKNVLSEFKKLPVEVQDKFSWQEFGKGFKDGLLGALKYGVPVVEAGLALAGKRDVKQEQDFLAMTDKNVLSEFKKLPVEVQDKFSWQEFGKGFKDGFFGTLEYVVPVAEAAVAFAGKRDVKQEQEFPDMTDKSIGSIFSGLAHLFHHAAPSLEQVNTAVDVVNAATNVADVVQNQGKKFHLGHLAHIVSDSLHKVSDVVDGTADVIDNAAGKR